MRTVLHEHKTAAAGCSAEKTSAGKSSSGHGSAWGDTPDTAEMECIGQMEREALRQRLENFTGLKTEQAAAVGIEIENAGQQAAQTASAGPRQLMFSPVIDTDPLGGSSGNTGHARPGSGRLRSTQRRQLSNLGRTSLANSSAAVAAENRSLPLTLQQPQIEITNPNDAVVLHRLSVGAVRSSEASRKENSGAVKRQKVENNSKVESKDHQVVNSSGFDDACEFSDSSDDDEEGRRVEGMVTSHNGKFAAVAAKTAPAPPPPLELRAYLSPGVAEAILRIGGPEKLYQWQAECLCRPGVLQVSTRQLHVFPRPIDISFFFFFLL
jgi:hypothetical protein